MDEDALKVLTESRQEVSRIYVDFMTRTAKLEELFGIAKRHLQVFHRETEKFRRPEIQKNSVTISNIIGANLTDRMKAYIKAGCRNSHDDVQNIITLHKSMEGLKSHIKEVEIVLNELQSLSEDALDIARTSNKKSSVLFDQSSSDDIAKLALSLEEEDAPEHLQNSLLSQVILMRMVFAMLKLDYEMQEKVVRALDLATPSGQLESYQLMWELQPYIDSKIMNLAWKHVPNAKAKVNTEPKYGTMLNQ